MSKPIPDRLTAPRPYVAYRPPFVTQQPTRVSGLRDVWACVQEFRSRIGIPLSDAENILLRTQRWSAESLGKAPDMEEVYGPWPPTVSREAFEAAVQKARERFGEPKHSMKKAHLECAGLDEEHVWLLPQVRADEVLAYLEEVAPCTVGASPPVHANYTCLFRLRNLETGKLFPGQTPRHYPQYSQVSVMLQQPSTATLLLVMPFAEPNDAVADYVMAVQEYAPVWMDPRYFDHLTPERDGSEYTYRRRRLPSDWIGRHPTGELRLDPSKSGLTPKELDLPTDAELSAEDRAEVDATYVENFYTVERALRDHHAAALLISGPSGGAKEYMVEQAAQRLGMSVHVVRTIRLTKDAPSVAEELRTLIWSLEARPAVLLIELTSYGPGEANDAIRTQMASRVLDRAVLPSEVRLVVIEETAGSEDTRQAAERALEARLEGFATRDQMDYLWRQHARAAYRDVSIVAVPHA